MYEHDIQFRRVICMAFFYYFFYCVCWMERGLCIFILVSIRFHLFLLLLFVFYSVLYFYIFLRMGRVERPERVVLRFSVFLLVFVQMSTLFSIPYIHTNVSFFCFHSFSFSSWDFFLCCWAANGYNSVFYLVKGLSFCKFEK